MIYQFECWEDQDGCGHKFEIEATMAEIPNIKPSCPNCNKKKSVIRDYGRVFLFGENKSLGMCAEKNAKLLTPSQKEALHKKHNAYRDMPYTGPKPLTKEQQERKNRGEKI